MAAQQKPKAALGKTAGRNAERRNGKAWKKGMNPEDRRRLDDAKRAKRMDAHPVERHSAVMLERSERYRRRKYGKGMGQFGVLEGAKVKRPDFVQLSEDRLPAPSKKK